SLTQPPAPPSQNVTINLINRLVERGILPKEDAVSLIKQAEADATLAREQAAATQAAVSEAQAIISQSLPSLAIPPQNPPTPDIPPYSGQSSVRVTYIPESVKAQMRDEIKNQVLAQARDERWANPQSIPEWTTRIRLFGDVRTRYEGIFFADGNDNTGAFPNFNAINTNPTPFNVKGDDFAPQLD
ncbi:MAG: putative porin, partial [Verrucomicrobia bacterium]|nr:putative porin [Verrucomicrobiota bacterium]